MLLQSLRLRAEEVYTTGSSKKVNALCIICVERTDCLFLELVLGYVVG